MTDTGSKFILICSFIKPNGSIVKFKNFIGTNTLAFFAQTSVMNKKFYNICFGPPFPIHFHQAFESSTVCDNTIWLQAITHFTVLRPIYGAQAPGIMTLSVTTFSITTYSITIT